MDDSLPLTNWYCKLFPGLNYGSKPNASDHGDETNNSLTSLKETALEVALKAHINHNN
jgi:hypothetical protein